MNSLYKRYRGWCILALIAVSLEIIFANLSSLRVLGEKRQLLAKNMETNAEGHFQLPMTDIKAGVKNLAVKLELEGAEYAEVLISLTDEGDKYEYTLPVTKVFSDIRETAYINLYPYGEVNEISIEINVPEGARAFIRELAVNEPQVFSFKSLRFFIILFLLGFFYLLREASGIHRIYYEEGNKTQLRITLLAACLLLIGGFFLASSNPECVKAPWLHHRQYQQLAHSLREGTVVLPLEADEGLINSENPYDTIALMVEGIPYHMDYAYYEGSYYVYFGIVPELLLYFPFHLLTGRDLPNYLAGFVFYALLVLSAFALCAEMIKRYGRKVPYLHYLLMSVGICWFSPYIYMIARPDLYNIPILAANAFILLGLTGWLRALNQAKGRGLALFMGSLGMALSVGCRPQMALFILLALILFYKPVVKERSLFSAGKIKETLALLLPFVLIAIPVCWYNQARFGSIIDFGATYSLTSNDMNHRGVSLERIWHGVYSFLFQPPTTTSDFPFLVKTDLDVAYMGKHMVEFTFGGLFSTNLLLLVIPYLFLVEKKKRLSGEVKGMLGIMLAAAIIITAFDVNSAGILQRYMGDSAPGLIVAAMLGWILYLSQKEGNPDYRFVSRIFSILFLLNVAYSFFLIFAYGDSINLMENNPLLFYRVSALFGI